MITSRYQYTKLFRKRHPERVKAHRIVFVALRNGTLKKKPCRVCGKKKVEAHHKGYLQPLKIIWLCKKHHAQADKRLKSKAKSKVKI